MPEEEAVEVAETVESTETTETAEVETTETQEVDVAQLQATNKKLYERAKKAEADLKAAKANPQPVNVEETVLLANGMPEELVRELKAVATVRGTTLLKAQTDPIFVAVKERFEKEQKQKDASLPGSRGAGTTKAQKTFTTPGLSRDEHRKMVIESR